MSALSVNRGDTLTAVFTVTGDTSGWTPRWVAKARSQWESTLDAAAILTATVGVGLTHVPGLVTSTITLVIAASATAVLEPGVYVWDLQLTSGTTVQTVLVDGESVGSLTVEADVTRTTP